MSPLGLEWLTFVNERFVSEPDFYEKVDWQRTHKWMAALTQIRVFQQLPPHYFRACPHYFPISPKELSDLLNDSSTSGSVLIPLLDSFKESWMKAAHRIIRKLMDTLSNHINHNLSLALHSSSAPTISTPGSQQHSTSISTFIQSQCGLEFMTFINNQFANDLQFQTQDWKEKLMSWVDALEGVWIIHGLSVDYFERIPMRFGGLFKYWITPSNRPASLVTLSEASIGQNFKPDVDQAAETSTVINGGVILSSEEEVSGRNMEDKERGIMPTVGIEDIQRDTRSIIGKGSMEMRATKQQNVVNLNENNGGPGADNNV
ncbi:hypothetical protein L218DRAFT_1007510 [Marasmius fiardii PR-910]|nr:hypothetical protein L218DRAFT_1007510 [Marasmius fiardii PR-910]